MVACAERICVVVYEHYILYKEEKTIPAQMVRTMTNKIFNAMIAVTLAAGMAGCTVKPKATASKKDVKVVDTETTKDDTFNDDIRAWRRAHGTEVKPAKPTPTTTPEPTVEPSAEPADTQTPAEQPTQNYASDNSQSYVPASNNTQSYDYADDNDYEAYVAPAEDTVQDEAPAPVEQPAVEEAPAAPADPTFPYEGSLGSLTLSNGYSVALDYYCQASVDDPYDAAYDTGGMFGCEYICDHARRKPDALAATENSDTMWIKSKDGTVRTLHKLGTAYADGWSLQLTDNRGNYTGQGNCFDWDVLNSYGAVLVFQTCALDAPADGLNLITYWG